MKWTLLIIIFILPLFMVGQSRVICRGRINLRNGKGQEWVTFPRIVNDSFLTISFNSSKWKTLAVTQYDVNHEWNLLLNGKEIGSLVTDEQKMVTYFSVPDGLLKENKNQLVIRPATIESNVPDDITISNVVLFEDAKDKLLQQGAVQISVLSRDDKGPLPSRITIVNVDQALQPVQAVTSDSLAMRSGVLYSGTGNFSLSLPAGTYHVFASRGFEYGVDSAVIQIKQGDKQKKTFLLTHEVKPAKWKSIDTHIHTMQYSGHGDASMKERILTIAGEGLDYAVITEHNMSVDIISLMKSIKMDKWFTAVRGDELTTQVGHFNVFPMKDSIVRSPDGITWNKIAALKKEGKVVILNHARDEHSSFRPADSMFNIKAADFPANAMEVMNSGSQQTDPRQLYADWLSLMSAGIFLTAVGSSDSHDVGRFIVGQSRTYVDAGGDLISNFIAHKTAVSFGLLTDVTVENDTASKRSMPGKTWRNKKIGVTIKVYHPSWVKATNVALYINGKKIDVERINDGKTLTVVRTFIQRPTHQATLVAIAEGPDPRVPWWPIAKPYQHSSPELNPIVMGVSAPVLIN